MPCIIRNWTEFEAFPMYAKDGFCILTKCSTHDWVLQGDTRRNKEGPRGTVVSLHAVPHGGCDCVLREGLEEAAGEDFVSDPKDAETKAQELFSESSHGLGDSDSSVFRVFHSEGTPDLINLSGEDGSSAKGEMKASAEGEPPRPLRLRNMHTLWMPLPRRKSWLTSTYCLSGRTCPG